MGENKKSTSPSEMEPKELPDVPALQDEFTRDFIQSEEPVKEGYYPFKSGTNNFTMDFPEDMIIIERGYSKGQNDGSEMMEISFLPEDIEVRDVLPTIMVHYYGFMSSEESSKESMSSRRKEELQFKSLGSDNEGKQYAEYADFTVGPYPGMAALIWNDNNQQIQISASVVCKEGLSEEDCERLAKPEKEKLLEIFRSIKLTAQEDE
ncbi:hypothetical protein SAMN05421663_10580 [Terribacillus halophilus]|uniref:Uncharacterized protein n=1 Tax=Terribacillus halophilus TaxID=361279 RepID=A0A1G6QGT6_9BACI|nr:hypothetical protein [Terribacillus halophilus]SDC91692.1 hypothetical protein SAMN05421663_10580 [Terribacillus halophilus]